MREWLGLVTILLFSFFPIPSAANGAIEVSDIVIADFGGGFRQYDKDVSSPPALLMPSGFNLGAASTPTGGAATTWRSSVGPSVPQNVSIFTPVGTLATTFVATQTSMIWDVGIFADGTIAVTDAPSSGGHVDLYDPTGAYLRALPIAGPAPLPLGSFIDQANTLWVADASTTHVISRFDAAGNLLSNFTAPAGMIDLVIDPADGSIWSSGGAGRIYHFTSSGTLISSFPTAFNASGSIRGVALDYNGNVLVSGMPFSGSASLYRYDKGGNLLATIPLTTSAPELIAVIVPEPAIGVVAAAALAALPRRRRAP